MFGTHKYVKQKDGTVTKIIYGCLDTITTTKCTDDWKWQRYMDYLHTHDMYKAALERALEQRARDRIKVKSRADKPTKPGVMGQDAVDALLDQVGSLVN